MVYDLVYTRCRQGVDITRKGQKISGEGYKVHSCTPAIMEEGVVDLQFLANAAQAKQSYTDPDFMDDAYLFYVPDFGKSFLMNFHPVHFDPNAPGDYSHRPGNFINHALIGDFSQGYPYEMFGDDAAWNAKARDEGYYYDADNPAELPERADIAGPRGHYSFDAIGAFVADGRQEALAKAVAFLVAQYAQEPEKRKFLVIRDNTSVDIELWVAAIECAFSPQLASLIPFATRMDKFAQANRYTVKRGIYQPQMNLQDPEHKQRYRAMVVGVDERDKINVNASKPLPNSPFVLLDGAQKQAMFQADTSHPYYRLITRFDGEHRRFCREFLPAFALAKPGEALHELCDVFTALDGADIRTVANALKTLDKYPAADTGIYRKIYTSVNAIDVFRFVNEDFSCVLDIADWLLKTSETAGDPDAKLRLTESVRRAFTGIMFGKADAAAKRACWARIRGGEFAADAARAVSGMGVLNDNKASLNAFGPADIAAFTEIYLDAAALTGGPEPQDIMRLAQTGEGICCRGGDTGSLHQIVSLLVSRVKGINTQEFLLQSLDGAERGVTEFVLKYIVGKCINGTFEMERFVKKVREAAFIGKDVLAAAFQAMDDPCGMLAKILMKSRLGAEEQSFILDILFHASEKHFFAYMHELIPAASRNKDKWNALITYISDTEDAQKHEHALRGMVQALVDTKQSEKSMTTLTGLLDADDNFRYFDRAATEARELILERKRNSALGKVFGLFGSGRRN